MLINAAGGDYDGVFSRGVRPLLWSGAKLGYLLMNFSESFPKVFHKIYHVFFGDYSMRKSENSVCGNEKENEDITPSQSPPRGRSQIQGRGGAGRYA